MQNYGVIVRPLIDLTNKNGFCWSPEAQEAFNTLKTAMAVVPTFVVPNFSKEFVLEMDASSQGLGVVLSQEGKPIAFLNQALSPKRRGNHFMRGSKWQLSSWFKNGSIIC